MLPASSAVAAARPSIAVLPAATGAGLVKKIGTSPTTPAKKRTTTGRKRLSRVIKEQRRQAKVTGLRAVALTLTYSDSDAYAKKHISGFIDCLRITLKRAGRPLPYVWVLECAGQLHYHLTLWLPRGYLLDPTKLAKWWPWGSTWMKSCRSVKAWGGYMAKFNSTARLPKRARIYGYGGLDDAGKVAVSRATLPRWLLTLLPTGHRARRRPGGGWVDVLTGVIYRSPYVWTPWGTVLLKSAGPPTLH